MGEAEVNIIATAAGLAYYRNMIKKIRFHARQGAEDDKEKREKEHHNNSV